MATATAVAPTQPSAPLTQQQITETLALPSLQQLPLGGASFFTEERIQRGETLQDLLQRLRVDDPLAQDYLRQATPELAGEQFIAGKQISAEVHADGTLERLYFPLNGRETILMLERQGHSFTQQILGERLESHAIIKSAEIETSLFGASDNAAIPDSIAIQLAELFSGEIDFHRDLRKGDRFSISYEMHYLNGRPIRSGKIIAAEFVNAGKTHRALWFARGEDGEYLTPEGAPLRKAFLRSPLKFSRISSGFKMRFHPILNTWRAHKGIDYAASTGTPVRATGDAVVAFVGKKGGYGNTVILKHQGRHETLYAHLSRPAKALRKGMQVSQGETIGYVGSSGWATGPHLHYEFRINNVAVNPLSANIPTALPSLSKAERQQFKETSTPLLRQLDRLKQSEIAYME
ncbi:MAG: peptidoglycan DD-metalloendopeptidase family protein [Dechloromonas sp.]|nr:peptidoglycan DD-metalloendopeptidase family protein [Dechloromonas sp.]